MADIQIKPIELDKTKWTEDEVQEHSEKGFRSLRADEIPTVTKEVRPSDYEHDLKRGAIDFNCNWFNYSFHNVSIPEGTVIDECNFAQALPNTDCIIGDYEITFINCNLCNVKLNPRWTIKNCLTIQSWIVLEEGEETRKFICAHPDELTGDEQPPDNAITEREY